MAPRPAGPARRRAVRDLAGHIARIPCSRPLLVAVDGVGASGKTWLADEIAADEALRGREVIRAGVDGFHNPSEVRYRRGRDSPEGYYEDSFDHDAMWTCLVGPLSEGGDRTYRKAAYDFRAESAVEAERMTARDDAVLLFDGVFLLRRELRRWWDFAVFVDAGFDTTLERALKRDLDLFGSREEVRRRYETRYIPGETIYLMRDRPRDFADVVFVNDDPERPVLKWRSSAR